MGLVVEEVRQRRRQPLRYRAHVGHGHIGKAPGERLFVVAFIAAWLVLRCLKALAHEMDYAIRCHKLKVEVLTLRLQQFKRMRDMGVGN